MNENKMSEESFFSFTLGRGIFSVPVRYVKEVFTFEEITPIPNSLDYMKGVMNVRGSVVSIADFRLLFGFNPSSDLSETQVIILEIPQVNDKYVLLGILADKVDVVKTRNERLMVEIQEIFNYNKGRYGVRRVHKELVNRGYNVNHKRVQRLMHDMKLFGKRPKEKYHSYKGEVGKIAANIIDRDFSTTAPLQKWTTDVSQFNFSWGKCYISPILDMCTNEIISYDLSLSPNLEQIRNMLDHAFEKFQYYLCT